MRVLILLGVLVAGCSLPQSEYTYVDNKEMAGRPGLFTGPPGAFVLLRGRGLDSP
ncbi:MAG: hypothetical protein H7Z10_06665 [Gemmatimonadaceae bacterium]|nr:hypothetical protein [Acetobacteraceae bacterium]